MQCMGAEVPWTRATPSASPAPNCRQICKEIIEKKQNMVRGRGAGQDRGPWSRKELALRARQRTLRPMLYPSCVLLQGNIMKDSFFSYTNAVYSAGEGIKHTILDNVETASVRVTGGLDNVAGVKIPKFATYVVPGESKMDLAGEAGGQGVQGVPAPLHAGCAIESSPQLFWPRPSANSRLSSGLLHTGLGRGGQQLQNCRKAYQQAVEVLAALANLQTAFYTLDEALKVQSLLGRGSLVRGSNRWVCKCTAVLRWEAA